ncbi:MAG: CBS domain-containing protein [Chromatocurvus sp.]
MKHLSLYPTVEVDELDYPEEVESLSLSSPALKFFTDFHHVAPMVIQSDTPAVEAYRLMRLSHVRMKFVVGRFSEFIGVVCADDLTERSIVMKVSEGYTRETIPVSELMTLKRDMTALDFDQVSKADIAEVISALKQSGQQHCLVVDQKTHRVRGIFSASDISRKLHLPIDIQSRSSFYKVFAATG